MSDENTTPADLAQQAADKAQQAQHDTEQGNYTQAGETPRRGAGQRGGRSRRP